MPDAPVADVRHILAHHNKVMSKTTGKERQWRLTDDLKKKIRTRLKTFTVDDLKAASTNLSHSSWHTGANPDGKEYCSPIWLFNTDAKVDKWLNELQHRPKGDGKMPDGRKILKGQERQDHLAAHRLGQAGRLAKSRADREARRQAKG